MLSKVLRSTNPFNGSLLTPGLRTSMSITRAPAVMHVALTASSQSAPYRSTRHLHRRHLLSEVPARARHAPSMTHKWPQPHEVRENFAKVLISVGVSRPSSAWRIYWGANGLQFRSPVEWREKSARRTSRRFHRSSSLTSE